MLFSICLSFSLKAICQTVEIKLVTKNNDTIKDYKIKGNYSFENNMILDLENELTVYDGAGKKKKFFPTELKSFSFMNNEKLVEFFNIEDKVFGLLLYTNKLRLLKVIKPGYTKVNFYVVERPNNGKVSFMEAMGLSRLISQKVIKREITDCPVILEKVDNKTLKINGEEGVIELVKSYESDCF
ncbi:hypothetical protein [Flavobacterium sp. KACC 22761]|uniref:hypothetical protein n=1 Tax=Flavobacterium sp. KACC 22761 TaxID=3092665 RepID=UPI002A75FCE5|nr:hypothetical protein [Flavobacterium sp. KACC 22761]WPO78512.1 hypothetical protein SCB73_19815 [Flavobacterium sp. KACC 22761]